MIKIPNKLLIIGAVILTAVLIGLFSYLIHEYGSSKYDAGSANEVARVNTETVKRIKNYEKAKVEIRKASDVELIPRYCKFVYDTTYDKCVSSVRIFEELDTD